VNDLSGDLRRARRSSSSGARSCRRSLTAMTLGTPSSRAWSTPCKGVVRRTTSEPSTARWG